VKQGPFYLPETFVPTMPVPLPTWLSHASGAIRRLADCPITLFLLLLAFNSIARPCSSSAHDARLYTLQALNAATDGAFADDIFLCFGSQDQYSLFSRVVGPMVSVLDVRWTFFILYLIFNVLFIAGLFRFVRALIEDRLISTLALVFLVTAPLGYGGHGIFMVHEQFFTPRLVAAALTLFALERLLRHAFVTAFALLAIGVALHPLMAFGGIMVAVAYVASSMLPTRLFVGLTAATLFSFAGLLCMPSIAQRAFGAMDDEWHQWIRLAVGYNYPDAWFWRDWLNLGVAFALPIAACWSLFGDDPMRRRFLTAVTLASAVGFLTTLAASFLPYALLFQAQPYRVLWILQTLQAPLGFLLIARWSASPSMALRMAALALVGFFCVVYYIPNEFLIIAMAVPVSFIISLASEENKQPGWWWYTVARGFVLGAIGWMAYRSWFFVVNRDVLWQFVDVDEFVMVDVFSPIVCVVAFLRFLPTSEFAPRFAMIRLGSLAASILVPCAVFAIDAFTPLRDEYSLLGKDIAFLHDFIQTKDHKKPPAIYWSLGRPDLLWVDVPATSYFDILQTAGVMFNRKTAEEIDRRTGVVGKFEMVRQRREELFVDDGRKISIENLFKLSFNCSEPSREDLIALCQQQGLDYVVIPQEFPGLHSASNGRIYVYDCSRVRSICRVDLRLRGGMPVFHPTTDQLFLWSSRN